MVAIDQSCVYRFHVFGGVIGEMIAFGQWKTDARLLVGRCGGRLVALLI